MNRTITLCFKYLFVLTISSGLVACGAGSVPDGASADATETALPVVVATASRRDIAAQYHVTAALEADNEALVLARVGGEVNQLLVEEGDTVTKGQPLATLDGERLALAAAKTRAELERSKRELARMENLHERGLVSSAALDDARFTRDNLKASYAALELEHSYATIAATIDGVVSSRHVNLGAGVQPGAPMFEITDTSTLVAYLNVPQTALREFAEGVPAAIRVDAAPDETFIGTVTRLSPTINPSTGTFRATVHIDNRARKLAPGMFGKFEVALDTHEDAIVVPRKAVIREDGDAVVYVVENGAAKRRRVEVGIAADGVLEITSGLTPFDEVVLEGQTRLRNGARVMTAATAGSTTG